MMDGIERIIRELRTYSPAGDEYHGAHIHKGWANKLEAELAALNADRRVLQSNGEHDAPCARYCEANAYMIELRRVNAELAALRKQNSDPVAWVRRHPDGTLTDEFLAHKAIETGRKNSGAWVPLGPIAAVPEDVLELLGRAYAKLIKYGVENTDPLLMDELKLELMK